MDEIFLVPTSAALCLTAPAGAHLTRCASTPQKTWGKDRLKKGPAKLQDGDTFPRTVKYVNQI